MKYLVVGLGNIGAEYATTRHNMGFMVLDAWAQASNAVFTTERYGAVAEISFKGRQFVLLKPSTYMNLSGNAVRYWLQKLDLGVESLLVISDDLNLPFGTIRMRARGSDGGHNGLENIIWTLESDQFARIRIGIGNDFARKLRENIRFHAHGNDRRLVEQQRGSRRRRAQRGRAANQRRRRDNQR